MDAHRFDRLSQHVGKQASRRDMIKAAAGGAVALLGVGAISRAAAAATGFNGDTCDTNSDCRDGLTCQGASSGLLGGSLAGIPYGPPGVSLPILTGKSGTCRYHNGCARVNQVCQRNDDCCNGEDLFCDNNHCKKR